MKKLMTLALAIVALASCSKEGNEGIDANAPVEIKLNAGIEATSRAAISTGDTVTGLQFVRTDGDALDVSAVTAVTTTGDVAANGKITFTDKQYYPAADGKTHIIGFYPAATITKGVANMTITGQEDVMYAGAVSGSTETPIATSLSFVHKLTQFKFVIVRDGSTSADITDVNVTIKDTKSTFNMNLADGVLSNWGDPISTIKPIADATATKTATATTPIMLEPELASITLSVTATGYDAQDITITGSESGKFLTGKAYTITLTFKQVIEANATFANWTEGTATGGEIK